MTSFTLGKYTFKEGAILEIWNFCEVTELSDKFILKPGLSHSGTQILNHNSIAQGA